jgi:alpha-tubulin suppressor-like RCC1 family protein
MRRLAATSVVAVGVSLFQCTTERGEKHTCATKRSGTLFCWGAGDEGQLGLLDVKQAAIPTRVGERSDWSDVRAGDADTCGVAGGKVYCWGTNGYGNIAKVGDGPIRAPTLLPIGQ